uniref:inositol-phosphate phosphatase n=1 Tax=Sinocyclocheilus anshuiensis TaxID=1608454 RepID=A0A671MJN2_9TELE
MTFIVDTTRQVQVGETHTRGNINNNRHQCSDRQELIWVTVCFLHQVVQSAVKQEKQVSSKSTPTDLVTEADHQVEELIISTLREQYPSHRYKHTQTPLTQVQTHSNTPHTGPNTLKHPSHRSKHTQTPLTQVQTHSNTPHTGPNTLKHPSHSHGSQEGGMLISTGSEASRTHTSLDLYVAGRVIGSSTLALCHITSGAAEAYYQYGLHCWDIAAAAVIIREAGGYVIDTTGGALDLMSRRVVAAGTREIADYVLKQLQPINYSRDDLP